MNNPNIVGDWIEEQKFAQVHEIVLGRLTSVPLLTELVTSKSAVYVKDTKGRTALAWATARA